MDRRTCLALVIALSAVGCSKSSTSPSNSAPSNNPKFVATLSPANEVPAITNADVTGSGTATVTLNVTRDSNGNVTSATADFTVTMSGFPPNTTLTGAHIHQAPAGATAGVLVPAGIASGQIVLNASGAGSFTTTAQPVDAAVAQAIINGPAGYYFNIHTQLNTGGAARGQLVAQ